MQKFLYKLAATPYSKPWSTPSERLHWLKRDMPQISKTCKISSRPSNKNVLKSRRPWTATHSMKSTSSGMIYLRSKVRTTNWPKTKTLPRGNYRMLCMHIERVCMPRKLSYVLSLWSTKVRWKHWGKSCQRGNLSFALNSNRVLPRSKSYLETFPSPNLKSKRRKPS